MEGKRYACPKGTYAMNSMTTSPTCEGKCQAGYYCTEGSASPTQNKCENDRIPGKKTGKKYTNKVYCPPGSWEPTQVSEGFYCIHTGIEAGAMDIYDPGLELCSAEIPCDPGYYCSAGRKHPCPPGTFGWRHGLTTQLCSGLCAAGYYCPSILDPQFFPGFIIYYIYSNTYSIIFYALYTYTWHYYDRRSVVYSMALRSSHISN